MAVATDVNQTFLTKVPGPIGYVLVEQTVTRIVTGFDQKGYMALDPRVKKWRLTYTASVAPSAAGLAMTFYPAVPGITDVAGPVSSAVNHLATGGEILYGLTPSSGTGGVSVVAFSGVDVPFTGEFLGGINGIYWKITGVTAAAQDIVTRYIRLGGQVG